MTTAEAIDALRPFTSKVPEEALEYVRAHWDDVEPILLEEIRKKLEAPAEEDDDALFLYAIHLCAEMCCVEAFPLFVRIARLPNLLLDHVLGDILTETFPQMLARTCNGRADEIKALVEDPALNDFSRGSALRALTVLVVDEKLAVEELSAYCTALLSHKLERRASNAWDTAIDTACEVKAPGALPLIKAAYERRLANPQTADLEYVIAEYERPGDISQEEVGRYVSPFQSTEAAMSFFVSSWGKEDDHFDELQLLEVLSERERPVRAVDDAPPKVGRNAPCPCGSGKKYKRCCLGNRPEEGSAPPTTIRGNPVCDEHVVASDWMEAGYRHMQKHSQWRAYACWRNCWDELLRILPGSLQNPAEAAETGAFEGYDFLTNWLQDFEMLLVELAEHSFYAATYAVKYLEAVPGRFADLHPDIRQNMEADLARCMGRLGRTDDAIAILKTMVKNRPESAEGYVELADHYCFDAEEFNRRPDFNKARKCLQSALKRAEDCPDHDVALRLEDLDAMEASMGRALL